MAAPRTLARGVLAIAMGLLVACSSAGAEPNRVPTVATTLIVGGEPTRTDPASRTLVAAGDVAMCANPGSKATAALLEKTEGMILALGDEAYNHGSTEDFANCYDPAWGRFKERTRPVPGNHEYEQAGAGPYFEYFGKSAGKPGEGWYSFDLGGWHVVALNSNCGPVGGCKAESPQGQWLRQDLASHQSSCLLAYWHHPRFSSGLHSSDPLTAGFWQILYDAGADVVLSGHDHDYERFAPLNPAGEPDPARGIRQFVVGTGGADSYRFVKVQPGSEARKDGIFGVLKLTLRARSYEWQYVAVEGQDFSDTGTATCHGRTKS